MRAVRCVPVMARVSGSADCSSERRQGEASRGGTAAARARGRGETQILYGLGNRVPVEPGRRVLGAPPQAIAGGASIACLEDWTEFPSRRRECRRWPSASAGSRSQSSGVLAPRSDGYGCEIGPPARNRRFGSGASAWGGEGAARMRAAAAEDPRGPACSDPRRVPTPGAASGRQASFDAAVAAGAPRRELTFVGTLVPRRDDTSPRGRSSRPQSALAVLRAGGESPGRPRRDAVVSLVSALPTAPRSLCGSLPCERRLDAMSPGDAPKRASRSFQGPRRPSNARCRKRGPGGFPRVVVPLHGRGHRCSAVHWTRHGLSALRIPPIVPPGAPVCQLAAVPEPRRRRRSPCARPARPRPAHPARSDSGPAVLHSTHPRNLAGRGRLRGLSRRPSPTYGVQCECEPMK